MYKAQVGLQKNSSPQKDRELLEKSVEESKSNASPEFFKIQPSII